MKNAGLLKSNLHVPRCVFNRHICFDSRTRRHIRQFTRVDPDCRTSVSTRVLFSQSYVRNMTCLELSMLLRPSLVPWGRLTTLQLTTQSLRLQPGRPQLTDAHQFQRRIRKCQFGRANQEAIRLVTSDVSLSRR